MFIAENRLKRCCWCSSLAFTFTHSVDIGGFIFFVSLSNYFLNLLFVLYWDWITFHIVTFRKAQCNSGGHGSSLKCPVELFSAWIILVVIMLSILLSSFSTEIVNVLLSIMFLKTSSLSLILFCLILPSNCLCIFELLEGWKILMTY